MSIPPDTAGKLYMMLLLVRNLLVWGPRYYWHWQGRCLCDIHEKLLDRGGIRQKGSGIVPWRYNHHIICASFCSIFAKLDRLAGTGSPSTCNNWNALQTYLIQSDTSKSYKGLLLFAVLEIGNPLILETYCLGRINLTRWIASPIDPDTTGMVPALAMTFNLVNNWTSSTSFHAHTFHMSLESLGIFTSH